MAAQDDFESLAALAKRLKLDDKQADSFISESMERLGYKAKRTWEDGAGDDDDGSGSFFGQRREQRSTRGEGKRFSQYG